jgi:hypothetical protein
LWRVLLRGCIQLVGDDPDGDLYRTGRDHQDESVTARKRTQLRDSQCNFKNVLVTALIECNDEGSEGTSLRSEVGTGT